MRISLLDSSFISRFTNVTSKSGNLVSKLVYSGRESCEFIGNVLELGVNMSRISDSRNVRDE